MRVREDFRLALGTHGWRERAEGLAMLDALVGGTTDADMLADLALGRLRKKLPELREALDGRVQSHHRLLLKHILAHIHFIETTLEQLQTEIEERLNPLKEAMELLMSIPGIQASAATAILAEIWTTSNIYWLNRALGVPHNVACPSALIGASNFFELADERDNFNAGDFHAWP